MWTCIVIDLFQPTQILIILKVKVEGIKRMELDLPVEQKTADNIYHEDENSMFFTAIEKENCHSAQC